MEVKIVQMFEEKDIPRYAFGLISEDNYVVICPVNEGDNTFKFKENDIIKILTISKGPVSAINKTTGEEIGIGLCETSITSEEIRTKKYYPMFK